MSWGRSSVGSTMSDPSNPAPLDDTDLAAYRSVLEEVRLELEHRAALLRDGADIPSGGISFGKRVGEGTSIAIQRFEDVAIHGQAVQQLSDVEQALARLARGHIRHLSRLRAARSRSSDSTCSPGPPPASPARSGLEEEDDEAHGVAAHHAPEHHGEGALAGSTVER